MGESVELHGTLQGHSGWVTCISNCHDDSDTILSGSRDKTIVIWKLSRKKGRNDKVERVEGVMHKRLKGHNHFVSGIDVSVDRQYAISSSWDGTLRLWNLNTGETHKKFFGHKKDVLSVAFSADNRKIVSGGRDNSIKVWNVVGQEKVNISSTDGGHKDWVTCCRFSPNADDPVIVTCGRDSYVKVWQRTSDQTQDDQEKIELKHNLKGHDSYVNSVTVSPDGSLCASGGKDGIAMLWDLNEGKSLSSLEAKGEITCLTFSPNRYWLCGAVGSAIKIWDLETKDVVGTLDVPAVDEGTTDNKGTGKKKRKRRLPVLCTCICWSQDGKTLYAGYSDGAIRVWTLISNEE